MMCLRRSVGRGRILEPVREREIHPSSATSGSEGDRGGSCEVETPGSPFLGGNRGDTLPLGCGRIGGRAAPLPGLEAELGAPQDLPLACRGLEAWAIS